MTPHNQSVVERLSRIETLLEGIDNRLTSMEQDTKVVKNDLHADQAELAKLKNRGAGILIGVGLFAGSVGANVDRVLARFLG